MTFRTYYQENSVSVMLSLTDVATLLFVCLRENIRTCVVVEVVVAFIIFL